VRWGGEEMETKRDGTRRASETAGERGEGAPRQSRAAGATDERSGGLRVGLWPAGRAGLLRSACGGGGTARSCAGVDRVGAPPRPREILTPHGTAQGQSWEIGLHYRPDFENLVGRMPVKRSSLLKRWA
jgi:hypothetical protein